eukprot:CAMPEP_0116126198 /NCGR_PEP_ID=MMETSP0329-20121206/6209_1 /TAXON_ID=697910 /ORGANISM="Pseudo-nitzschia arenysensis, Strain B593" /LENGTH=575 /DNA_ID=CAMNT_0003620275 /DNA_START=78 /DNA_END=1805 /DNA_ORIENTATION=-
MANDNKERPQQPQQQQQQHIRPRVQRKSPRPNKSSNPATNDVNNNSKTNVEIEETRKRMESWMGLGNKKTTTKAEATTTTTTTTKTTTINAAAAASTAIASNQIATKQTKKQPVSILKTPKYSQKSSVVAVNSDAIHPKTTTTATATTSTDSNPVVLPLESTTIVGGGDGNNDDNYTLPSTTNARKKSSVICKDIVVERDPSMATTKRKMFRHRKVANPASIEGYVPAMGANQTTSTSSRTRNAENTTNKSNNSNKDETNNDADNDDNTPLIIDSLEGLMKAAGEPLPENPDKITPDTQVVEANISFSVMTQDQYETNLPTMKEEQEEERQKQLEVFMGKQNIFDDDDDESVEGALDQDDDDDDDAVMELLLGSDIEDEDEEDEPERPLQVKAFTLLWDALTNWMTHETVVWMKALQEKQNNNNQTMCDNNPATFGLLLGDNDDDDDKEWAPMVDKSDIGASRCAGVLAMLRLYLGQCMDELGHKVESRRKADKRLNDLMRTFDYSRENPKLSSAHWKAMACILLDAVMIESRNHQDKLLVVQQQLPPSVAKVGMSSAEFEYLSRKAVLVFDSSS